jgi:hypothetical protein
MRPPFLLLQRLVLGHLTKRRVMSGSAITRNLVFTNPLRPSLLRISVRLAAKFEHQPYLLYRLMKNYQPPKAMGRNLRLTKSG